MSISLIIPIHNAESDIYNTLNSVSKSLSKTDEILLILDNCTDNTLDLCQRWKREKEDKVNCSIYEVNFGAVSLSRNFGIEKSNNKWVAFSDHDDLVSPTIYQDLLHEAEYTNADVVRAGFIEKYTDKEVPVYPDFPLDTYAFHGIFIWNSLFKKTLLDKQNIRFIPGYGEDYEFNLCIARHAESQVFLNKCVYYWRLHDNNQHKKRKAADFFFRIDSILNNHVDYLESVPNANYAFTKWFLNYLSHLKKLFGYKELVLAANKYKDIKAHIEKIQLSLNDEYQQALSHWTRELW